nr:hypothetical protein BaRGS_004632 [Batillaria attramentaria]
MTLRCQEIIFTVKEHAFSISALRLPSLDVACNFARARLELWVPTTAVGQSSAATGRVVFGDGAENLRGLGNSHTAITTTIHTMPKSFLFTNRRYVPTPPPPSSDDDNNEVGQEVREGVVAPVVVGQVNGAHVPVVGMDAGHVHLSEVPYPGVVRHDVTVLGEQTEAVDLVVHKDRHEARVDDGVNHTSGSYNDQSHRYNTFERRTFISDRPYGHNYSNSSSVGSSGYIYTNGSDNLRSSVIYSVSNSSRDDGVYHTTITIPTTTSSDNGIDLSMKEYPRYQPALPATSDTEMHDKSSLSDGDSDSGCSTQNEARGHLPPEVEYGWAECHAHFSLLYDLMTQSSRSKIGGKDPPEVGHYTSREEKDEVPYDYSKTTGRSEGQEPPVLYELMTESPRKDSGRDAPEHALEVEIPMQQYHHLQNQHHHQVQQQHGDERRPVTAVDVPPDNMPVPRYEARRSLNDLLYAAGLPPASPPTPASLSPSSPGSPESENHACDDCGKRYSTSSNLARHRQTHRSHGDKKARKCPHCDKLYVSMPAFSMHVRTHNQGCACPHCGKRFSRPWLLQGHIRTHTGEKPFACPQCGKSFADKSNLRAHIQTHSTEKPYVCGRCGKAFALKSYLYKHEESSCMRGERFRPMRKISNSC